MEFTLTQDFPAGLDALWAVFGTPDYPLRKYGALGATDVRLHRFQSDTRCIEVELERDVPVRPARLPASARAVVGRRQTLVHRSVWRRTAAHQADAELEIVPIGMPVHARGVGSLLDGGRGSTRMTLTWRVDSVLGDKVARVFAEQVRAALDDDHAFTLDYLRSHPPAAP